MKIPFLEQLKLKCDCDIEEIDHLYIIGIYIIKNQGFFEAPRICINRRLPCYEKEGVLIHEIGHRRDHIRKGLELFSSNQHNILREVLAELYTLHLLLKNKRKKAIESRFSSYKEHWYKSPHKEALKIIESRRIYKRCIEFVEN